MLDGVVAQGRQGLAFRGARVRQRVLGLFEGRGLLSRETVAVMQGGAQRRIICACGYASRSAG